MVNNKSNENKGRYLTPLIIGILTNLIAAGLLYIGHFSLMKFLYIGIGSIVLYLFYHFRAYLKRHILNIKRVKSVIHVILIGITVFVISMASRIIMIKYAPKGVIRGEVVTENNECFKNVDVNIFSSQLDSIGWVAVTDDRGVFIFDKLNIQKYYGILYKTENGKIYTTEFIELADEKQNIAMACVLSSETTERHGFDPVNFGHKSAKIDKVATRELAKVAIFLQENDGYNLVIQGHCSTMGSPQYNIKLGARRAKEVRDYLIEQGISKDRLMMVSYGKKKPLSTKDSELAHARNRRVEFIVLPESKVRQDFMAKGRSVQRSKNYLVVKNRIQEMEIGTAVYAQ